MTKRLVSYDDDTHRLPDVVEDHLSASIVGGAFDDNTDKADGPLSDLASGGTWQVNGAASAVRGGRMTLAAGIVGATYPRLLLDGRCAEAGGELSFGTGSTIGCNATILVTSDASLANIGVHFVSSPTSWIVHIREASGSFEVKGTGTYTSIPDNERRRVGVGISGNTVVLLLADGTTYTYTDSRVRALTGPTPFVMFESLTNASTDRLPGWSTVYAATREAPRLHGNLAAAALALSGIAEDVTANNAAAQQVRIGRGPGGLNGQPAVTFGPDGAQTAMYYNPGNGFFFLPDLAVLVAPGGKMYFGGGLDTVMARLAANVLGMGDGDSFQVNGSWDGGKIRMGDWRFWVDASNKLRMLNGEPGSDTDGVVVGSQA